LRKKQKKKFLKIKSKVILRISFYPGFDLNVIKIDDKSEKKRHCLLCFGGFAEAGAGAGME